MSREKQLLQVNFIFLLLRDVITDCLMQNAKIAGYFSLEILLVFPDLKV